MPITRPPRPPTTRIRHEAHQHLVPAEVAQCRTEHPGQSHVAEPPRVEQPPEDVEPRADHQPAPAGPVERVEVPVDERGGRDQHGQQCVRRVDDPRGQQGGAPVDDHQGHADRHQRHQVEQRAGPPERRAEARPHQARRGSRPERRSAGRRRDRRRRAPCPAAGGANGRTASARPPESAGLPPRHSRVRLGLRLGLGEPSDQGRHEPAQHRARDAGTPQRPATGQGRASPCAKARGCSGRSVRDLHSPALELPAARLPQQVDRHRLPGHPQHLSRPPGARAGRARRRGAGRPA